MKKQHFLPILKISVLSSLILLVMSCNNEVKQIDIQGHRGCRGLMPENTLPAFEKAIDLGVNTLELDIVISKDNKVVVSHEPFMNSVICLNPDRNEIPDSIETHYNLYKMNYNEIKQFDCGLKNHPRFLEQQKIETYKPLLSEVFELVKTKNSNVKFNIEIKSEQDYYNIFTPKPEAYVAIVLDELKTNDMMSRVNLQSFDVAILEEIKKQAPKMGVALLIEDNEVIEEKLRKLSFIPEIISPYFKLLSKNSVKTYQDKGYKIIPWTINEEKDMEQMIKWKVDGIITDYPNRLNNVLNQ